MSESTVLALFAHPDDIEFVCAGTLALLADQGWAVHCVHLGDGSCGGTEAASVVAARRWQEAQAAARCLGATWHPPLFSDLGIFFNEASARRVASLVRSIAPDVLITHAVADYMEDHMQTARLAQQALFSMGMVNFSTHPQVSPCEKPRALYHALPHGLCHPHDGRRAYPAFYVGIDDAMERKRRALACHESQGDWLKNTQGMATLVDTMEGFAGTLGAETGRFQFAEGFTRHLHLGMGPEEFYPLESALEPWVLPHVDYPGSPSITNL